MEPYRPFSLHTPVRPPEPEKDDEPDVKQPPVPPDQAEDIVPQEEPPKLPEEKGPPLIA